VCDQFSKAPCAGGLGKGEESKGKEDFFSMGKGKGPKREGGTGTASLLIEIRALGDCILRLENRHHAEREALFK